MVEKNGDQIEMKQQEIETERKKEGNLDPYNKKQEPGQMTG